MFSVINMIKKKGNSIIETIIYVGLLALMVSSITAGLGTLIKTYNKIKTVRKVENSAISVMDRIVREVRNAETAVTSSGLLSLTGKDDAGSAQTISFSLSPSDNKIYVSENGSQLGPLSLSGAKVSDLSFTSTSTSVSQIIRIEMTISSTSTGTHKFYDSVILRGSYE